MNENKFCNELFNIYDFFFRRILYFLLRIKDTEAVKITENTDINGLLYNYRKNMYVCPKGDSIIVYDAKKIVYLMLKYMKMNACLILS